MTKDLKIIQDIFLLYELSLAVGVSLHPRENGRHFLQVLLSRKGLSYVSIWLRKPQGDGFRLFCGMPTHQVDQEELPADHFIIRQLAGRSFFSLSSQDENFRELVQEKNISRGAGAVFSLGDLGFLKMFSVKREEAFPKMEMSQMEGVIRKFKVSLDGSLAYERLQEESRRREEVQAELAESNARYVDLFENMNDALAIFDAHGKVLGANQAARKLAGSDEVDLSSFVLADILHPQDAGQAKETFATLLTKGAFTGFEVRIITLQGETKHVQINSSGIFKEGRLVGSRNIIRDITKQKVAEEALRNSQIRMTSLIRNLQAGILLENENRQIVLVNQFFCDIFHIPAPPEVLQGMDCSHSVEASKHLFADQEGFVRGIDRLLAKGELVVNEEWQMNDGRILERDYIPLYSEGEYLGHLWQYRDVTEKRRNAEVIRQSEEKYRGIIENMELGLLEVDNEGRVLRAYDRFCDMIGYREEELIGQDAREIFVPPSQRHIIDKQSADRLQKKAGVYEVQLQKKDGSPMVVLISGAPVVNAQGEVVGSLGIHYDITNRKKLESELAEAKQQAEQARLAEQQFLANMSHEIRTPMNSVIGMTHLLYETPISLQQKEYLDSLRFSADTLMDIINNILDLSKIEAGELAIEERPFNLLQLVQSIKQAFQFKLKEKPVNVYLDFDHRIRNLIIADPTRLNQILTNLMGNASKFTNAGSIGIRVILLSEQDDQYQVAFEVYDTGIGIPKEKIDLIFQNFKQVDVKVTRKYGGTGLGLAIVKQLVDILGGRISVESQEGVGSTFRVELAVKNSGEKATEKEIWEDEPGWEEKQLLSGLKILVVEDNPMNQRLISRILDTWESNYLIAADGRQALDLTSQTVFDLILMDIHMPGIDGCETTRRIRQDVENPNRKCIVIALTASALLEEKNRALEAGMNDFLTKPFSPVSLRNLVLRWMGWESAHLPARTVKPPEETDIVGIDLSYLYEFSGNDHHFIIDMIETFLRETPQSLSKIKAFRQAEDWDQLYRLVHGLKANLMMLGMAPQERQATRIEKMIKNQQHDHPHLRPLIDQLLAAVEAAFPLLRQALADLS